MSIEKSTLIQIAQKLEGGFSGKIEQGTRIKTWLHPTMLALDIIPIRPEIQHDGQTIVSPGHFRHVEGGSILRDAFTKKSICPPHGYLLVVAAQQENTV